MSSKVACLILAAGESKRFGENKFLTKIGNHYLLERTLEAFLNHGKLQNEIIVITGRYSKELKFMLEKCSVKQIHNPSFNLGMSSSILAGLESLRSKLDDYSGLIIHPGDIPFISQYDLSGILACHETSPNKIIIPQFNNQRGHPVLIPKIMFSDLETIGEETTGLRGFIGSKEAEIEYVIVTNEGILRDIDTKSDMEQLSHLK